MKQNLTKPENRAVLKRKKGRGDMFLNFNGFAKSNPYRVSTLSYVNLSSYLVHVLNISVIKCLILASTMFTSLPSTPVF